MNGPPRDPAVRDAPPPKNPVTPSEFQIADVMAKAEAKIRVLAARDPSMLRALVISKFPHSPILGGSIF